MLTAIKSITAMITITIQPFGRRKLAALGVALLCASTASCFADAMYLTVGHATPRQAERSVGSSQLRTAVQAAPREFELNRWTANFRQVEQGNHTIPAPAINATASALMLRAS